MECVERLPDSTGLGVNLGEPAEAEHLSPDGASGPGRHQATLQLRQRRRVEVPACLAVGQWQRGVRPAGEPVLARQSDHVAGDRRRRVVLAALVVHPGLEPEGVDRSQRMPSDLDEATASAVFATVVQAARETSAALLVATHNAELAARADAMLRLHNGVIERS